MLAHLLVMTVTSVLVSCRREVVQKGEIELEAEVPEIDMARLKPGLAGTVTLSGVGALTGAVRIVSPEVDKATRQGKVRIGLGADPRLRIGSFGRGSIATRSAVGLAVPVSAVMFGEAGAHVQLVVESRVVSRKVETGLQMGEIIEIRSGLAEGDTIVARAGTFLREGDLVTPVKSTHSPVKVN